MHRSPIPDSKENGIRDMEQGPLRDPNIESGFMKVPELGMRGGRRDSTAAEKRNDYKNSIHENPLHSLVIYRDFKKKIPLIKNDNKKYLFLSNDDLEIEFLATNSNFLIPISLNLTKVIV